MTRKTLKIKKPKEKDDSTINFVEPLVFEKNDGPLSFNTSSYDFDLRSIDPESILIGPKDCVDKLNTLQGDVVLKGGDNVRITEELGNKLRIDAEGGGKIDVSELSVVTGYYENLIKDTDKVLALRTRVNDLTIMLYKFYIKNA